MQPWTVLIRKEVNRLACTQLRTVAFNAWGFSLGQQAALSDFARCPCPGLLVGGKETECMSGAEARLCPARGILTAARRGGQRVCTSGCLPATQAGLMGRGSRGVGGVYSDTAFDQAALSHHSVSAWALPQNQCRRDKGAS